MAEMGSSGLTRFSYKFLKLVGGRTSSRGGDCWVSASVRSTSLQETRSIGTRDIVWRSSAQVRGACALLHESHFVQSIEVFLMVHGHDPCITCFAQSMGPIHVVHDISMAFLTVYSMVLHNRIALHDPGRDPIAADFV